MLRALLFIVGIAIAAQCVAAPNGATLRIGHFATVTHAPALVARALSREGPDWYGSRVPGVANVEWFLYQSGNGAIEALHADSLDFTFTGPAPLFAAQTRFGADSFRIVSGVTKGGSALVVQGDGRIQTPADFRGKRVATPAIGNSQDVACRAWLLEQGFKVALGAGDVSVIPTEYPDQLMLFRSGDLDAVWVVEPWVSRFEAEAGGKVFYEDQQSVTTLLAVGDGTDAEQTLRTAAVKKATVELIEWMHANPQRAQELARAELARLTKREMNAAIFAKAWSRLSFNAEVDEPGLLRASLDAVRTGLFRKQADVAQLVMR